MTTLRDAVLCKQHERLDELAIQAWAKWSTPDGSGARRDYIAAQMKLDVTWAMVEKYHPQGLQILTTTIGLLLNRAKDAIEAQKQGRPTRDAGVKPAGGGQKAGDTQVTAAPANPSRDAARPQATQRSEPAKQIPASSAGAPAAPTLSEREAEKRTKLKILADKQSARSAAAAALEIRLSKLDTFLVYGKAIGDCTVTEVRSWIETREKERREASRDVLFARNLVANLPGDAKIRDWWKKPEDVDGIFAKAEAENAE